MTAELPFFLSMAEEGRASPPSPLAPETCRDTVAESTCGGGGGCRGTGPSPRMRWLKSALWRLGAAWTGQQATAVAVASGPSPTHSTSWEQQAPS